MSVGRGFLTRNHSVPGKRPDLIRRHPELLQDGRSLFTQLRRRQSVGRTFAVERQRDVDNPEIRNVGVWQIDQHPERVELGVLCEVCH